jgi:hypothetical protein
MNDHHEAPLVNEEASRLAELVIQLGRGEISLAEVLGLDAEILTQIALRAIGLIEWGKFAEAEDLLTKLARVDAHSFVLPYLMGRFPLDPSKLESLGELLQRPGTATSRDPAFVRAVQNKSAELELLLARGFERLVANADGHVAIGCGIHFEGDFGTQGRLLFEGFETLRAGADVLRDHEQLIRLAPQRKRPADNRGKVAVRSGLLWLVRAIDSSRWVPLDMDVDAISSQMGALVMALGKLTKTAEYAQSALNHSESRSWVL